MLSICIPTYNRANLLERSLKHLLTFSKIDIEVNISNNNSKDNTLKIIHKYKSKFAKFNVITTTKTIDIQKNFDLAMKLATQKYTMCMPDDDLANEDDIFKGISLLENDDNIMAVYGGFRKFNLQNEFLEEVKRSDSIETFSIFNAQNLLSRFVSLDLPLHRTKLHKHISSPHVNSSSISWEFIGIALSQGDISITPYAFFNHYAHKDQYTNVHNNNSHVHFLMISEAEIFLGRLKCSANEKIQAMVNYKAVYYRYMMWNSYQNNELIQARWAIKKGALYHPDLFEPFARDWDQSHLLSAALQILNDSIASKPQIKRVLIYANKQENIDMMSNLLKGKLLIEPDAITNTSSLKIFDHKQDFIIFFNEEDLETAQCGIAYNSEVFMNILNTLKFTSNEITFN